MDELLQQMGWVPQKPGCWQHYRWPIQIEVIDPQNAPIEPDPKGYRVSFLAPSQSDISHDELLDLISVVRLIRR